MRCVCALSWIGTLFLFVGCPTEQSGDDDTSVADDDHGDDDVTGDDDDSWTVELDHGIVVHLEVPDGADLWLPFDASDITMDVVEWGDIPPPTAVGMADLGGALLELGPSSAFDGWLGLRFEIPADLLTSGKVPGVMYYEEEAQEWIPVTATLDGTESTVEVVARLRHFSLFGLFESDPRIDAVTLGLPPVSGGDLSVSVTGTHLEGINVRFDGAPQAATWSDEGAWDGIVASPAPGTRGLTIVDGNTAIWEQDVRISTALDPDTEGLVDLAAAYAPVLSFHPDEQYSPVRLDVDYFREVEVSVPFLDDITVEGAAASDYLATHGHVRALMQGNDADPWEQPTSPPGSTDATVYWVAHEGGDRLFFTYWFFYHHDPKSGGLASLFADHPRDRESITVVADAGGSQPSAVMYYGHLSDQLMSRVDPEGPTWSEGGRVVVPWNAVDLRESCTHPVAHVALGSHALYPRAGTFEVLGFDEPAGTVPGGPQGVELCPADAVTDECNSYELLPLGVGADLSDGASFQHLAFSGSWIDVPWSAENEPFPPFTGRLESIPDWDGQTFPASNEFVEAVRWECDLREGDCADGVDSDLDGVTDCDDSDCEAEVDCWGTFDLALAPAAIIGDSESAHVGGTVRSAGDVDGDGLDDILIGAAGYGVDDDISGMAFLVFGATVQGGGTVSVADAAVRFGPDVGDGLGSSVSSAGDIDGDGLDDVLVGAFRNDEGGNDAGKTYLVLGGAIQGNGDYDLSGAHASFIGEAEEDNSGVRVSTAGDVDGDGLPDVLIGAYGSDDGGEDAGKVYLWLGDTIQGGGAFGLANADVAWIGEAEEDIAGIAVATAGDVDGDGLDDFLVGASWNDEAGNYAGKTYLVFGSEVGGGGSLLLAHAGASFTGEASYDYSGANARSAGDVDGDGLDDFLIGAPHADGDVIDTGRAYLVFGSTASGGGDFSLSDADAIFVGEEEDDWAGDSVSSAGDVDGDGLDDILIGAFSAIGEPGGMGKTYFLLGSTVQSGGQFDLADADAVFVGEGTGDVSGCSVAAAGDVDGNGSSDFLIAATKNNDGGTDAGKVYVIFGP